MRVSGMRKKMGLKVARQHGQPSLYSKSVLEVQRNAAIEPDIIHLGAMLERTHVADWRWPSLSQAAKDIEFSLYTDKEVESGTIELTVHYLGAKVYSKTTDLCEQNDCPIEEGKFVSSFEEKFPIYTPPVITSTF